MDIENFIYSINTNNLVITPKYTENQIDAITNFIKAIAIILPPIYILYKYFYKKEKKTFTSLDDVSDHVNNQVLTDAIAKIIQGLTFLFFAVKLYYFFKPNNTQLTLALLIKYFQKKKIITQEFYEIIKRLKPQGISNYT